MLWIHNYFASIIVSLIKQNIFPGPSEYYGARDVLYVGTTFTDHGDYRHDVPAISARSLQPKDDLFFAEYGFSSQSLLNIDVKYKEIILKTTIVFMSVCVCVYVSFYVCL